MTRHFLPLTMIVLIGCSNPPSNRAADIASLEWRPDLGQTIGQLEEVLETMEQQQPMNYTSSNLAFALDAQLYLDFERGLRTMRADQRTAAISSQRAWLEKREHETSEAYAEYEGGTLASYSGNMKYIELTRARIAEITGRPATTRP